MINTRNARDDLHLRGINRYIVWYTFLRTATTNVDQAYFLSVLMYNFLVNYVPVYERKKCGVVHNGCKHRGSAACTVERDLVRFHVTYSQKLTVWCESWHAMHATWRLGCLPPFCWKSDWVVFLNMMNGIRGQV